MMGFWAWLFNDGCQRTGHTPEQVPRDPKALTGKLVRCAYCYQDIEGLWWMPVFDDVTGRVLYIEQVDENEADREKSEQWEVPSA